ncbi:unnamed protein product [Camellia sinensis]
MGDKPCLMTIHEQQEPLEVDFLPFSKLISSVFCSNKKVAKGVMTYVTQEVKDLYHLLEHEFLPLDLASKVQPLLTKISKLGVVRSLALDVKVWEPSVIKLVQALGNVFVNSIWEGLLHAQRTFQADEIPMKFFDHDKHKQFFSKPRHDDHISMKEKFIHAKYAEKRFVHKGKYIPHLLLEAQQLWESVSSNDKKSVYRLIVSCEVDVNAIQPLNLSKGVQLQDKEQQSFDCYLDYLAQSLDGSSSSFGLTKASENQSKDGFLDGCSLLHLACQTADIGMVELLLQHGADINTSDSRGQTPLHHSIIRGRIGIAKLLLTSWEAWCELYRESHLGKRQLAYDGRKSVYTAGPLPFSSKDFVIKLVDQDRGARKDREFKVSVKFAAKPDIHHLQEFMRGRQLDTPQETIQVLDVVLRTTLSMNNAVVGRSFFSPSFGVGDLGNGFQYWKGFYQSMSARAFYEPILVTDFVAKYFNVKDLIRPLSDQECLKVKRALRGIKVELSHRKHVQCRRISDLSVQPTNQLT